MWVGKDPAQTLRSRIVQSLNLDVIGLCETFLVKDQDICVEGYTWFSNNRKVNSRRACRGLGGVGILVKEKSTYKF